VARVLTSGGAAAAVDGADTIAAMVERAGRSMSIVAGGGVRWYNVVELVRRSGVREVHARCGGESARIKGIADALAGA
jgi:copper homeostasis protein